MRTVVSLSPEMTWEIFSCTKSKPTKFDQVYREKYYQLPHQIDNYENKFHNVYNEAQLISFEQLKIPYISGWWSTNI
jgi:hypothetical protein